MDDIYDYLMMQVNNRRPSVKLTVVLVDGVPVKTPQWMIDIMEKAKKESERNDDM